MRSSPRDQLNLWGKKILNMMNLGGLHSPRPTTTVWPKPPMELSFDVDAAILQANQNTGVASGTNDPKKSADNVIPFVDKYFNEL